MSIGLVSHLAANAKANREFWMEVTGFITFFWARAEESLNKRWRLHYKVMLSYRTKYRNTEIHLFCRLHLCEVYVMMKKLVCLSVSFFNGFIMYTGFEFSRKTFP